MRTHHRDILVLGILAFTVVAVALAGCAGRGASSATRIILYDHGQATAVEPRSPRAMPGPASAATLQEETAGRMSTTARYRSPSLGFAVEYPAGWTAHANDTSLPNPNSPSGPGVTFESPSFEGNPMGAGVYSVRVSVQDATGQTLSGAVESWLSPIVPGTRDTITRRDLAVAGEPAIELTLPMIRWVARSIWVMHEERLYVLYFWPTALSQPAGLAGFDLILRTFTFVPVTGPWPTAALRPTPAPTPTAIPGPVALQDAIAIYAAVIRRLCTRDDSFGGTYQPAVVYLLRRTNDAAGDPTAPRGAPVVLPQAVQEGVAAALADLPARRVWVDSAADVPRDARTGEVAGHGALVTLGNIAPQGDGSVHVAASIYVASLAAAGQTYVLRKEDGVWVLKGNTGVQWMS